MKASHIHINVGRGVRCGDVDAAQKSSVSDDGVYGEARKQWVKL
jgi:hypothetical protein